MRQNDETGNTKITPLSLRPSWHDKPFEKPRRPALTKWKLSMEDTGTMIGVIIGIVGLLNILELLDQPEEGKWCMEGISGDDNQTDFSVPPTPTYYDLKQMDLKCRDLVVAFYMSISLSSASCCVAATALFFASHLRSWYLALTSAALHVTCMLSFPWETYVLWKAVSATPAGVQLPCIKTAKHFII
ncbi:unnamed protein product [Allacma fusca]|uniref:Uncharacterized protein n=1 Tax=Allacma fusca TaxID=39272 RepID=A0A8J2LMA7_9HEXA|nr:unnamed protein product [Allacma fusca]